MGTLARSRMAQELHIVSRRACCTVRHPSDAVTPEPNVNRNPLETSLRWVSGGNAQRTSALGWKDRPVHPSSIPTWSEHVGEDSPQDRDSFFKHKGLYLNPLGIRSNLEGQSSKEHSPPVRLHSIPPTWPPLLSPSARLRLDLRPLSDSG